jgi:oxygen-independent coproporphyrinogen-3 oxidase
LYQLTIEPGTRFAAMAARGELDAADPDHCANLYEVTQALTGRAGLPAYEISNHAAVGEESRHNLAYWRYQPYSGIGPGAHGRRAGAATQRHRKPENWLVAMAKHGHGIAEERAITPADKGVEALLMGLRLREGVDLDRIAAMAERPVDELIDRLGLARLLERELVILDEQRLRVAPAGMLLLDYILAEIVA